VRLPDAAAVDTRYNNPDGMGVTGDIYNQNGTHIGNDGKDDKRVYVENTTSDKQLDKEQAALLTALHDFLNTWGNTEGNGAGLTEIKNGDDIDILSRMIYAEAGGENSVGKEAVGDVIKNRADNKQTAYKDITEKHDKNGVYQFSAANPNRDESWRYYTPNDSDRQKANGEKAAYQASLSTAIKVYHRDSNGTGDITKGSDIYYSPRSMSPPHSKPKWDFSRLSERNITGINSTHFKFYKSK
jgi:spore germination cell wall hydrolase CwlJ-like protein